MDVHGPNPSLVTKRMQRALPSSRIEMGDLQLSNVSGNGEHASSRVVKENPVVVVGWQGCCMVHVIKRLLLGHGVNPKVYEVRDSADEISLIDSIENESGNKMVLPIVFIGGSLIGGLDTIMGAHISGELVTKLKDAGAIWL